MRGPDDAISFLRAMLVLFFTASFSLACAVDAVLYVPLALLLALYACGTLFVLGLAGDVGRFRHVRSQWHRAVRTRKRRMPKRQPYGFSRRGVRTSVDHSPLIGACLGALLVALLASIPWMGLGAACPPIMILGLFVSGAVLISLCFCENGWVQRFNAVIHFVRTARPETIAAVTDGFAISAYVVLLSIVVGEVLLRWAAYEVCAHIWSAIVHGRPAVSKVSGTLCSGKRVRMRTWVEHCARMTVPSRNRA